MKTKYIYLAAAALVAVPAFAQETYLDTKLVENDLNGTARYVGMGGAMEALGADISTISTNPAGLGLFRKSQVTLSGGLLMQTGAKKRFEYDGVTGNIGGKKDNLSFDQVGLVWAIKMENHSMLNLAFQYRKSRNFDQLLNAFGNLGGASQSKLAALKYAEVQDLKKRGYASDAKYIWNAVDENFASALGTGAQGLNYLDGKSYLFGQYQKGYIGEYDFSASGNINDRVYLGLTVGIHDVNYRSNSYYTENYQQGSYGESWEELRMDGTGYDVKLGVIFCPIEASPFRIGGYVNSPIFYDLDTRGTADLRITDPASPAAPNYVDKSNGATNDFRVNTPWKFGLSLGHTVGNFLAFGATYEFADYSRIDNRYKTGEGWDYYDGYYETSASDKLMNEHTRQTLKGVSTLKLGLEFKPVSAFALRVGYNYVSPMFETSGFRDAAVASDGSRTATSTDYTNWKATNRLTLGMGYSFKSFFADLAYQYSSTKGDFYPVGNQYLSKAYNNTVTTPAATNVKNDRHQLLMTLGYRF